eukprot:scaffold2162_cov398-Prasinococcus_capsulatus_cf.AAC.3
MRRYRQCSQLPSPLCEADLNSYILRHSLEATSIPEDPKDAIGTAFPFCEENVRLINETRQVQLQAIEEDDPCVVGRCEHFLGELRKLGLARIDRCTTHILQHLDQLVNDNKEVLLSHTTPSIKFGLWINHGRNPRVKVVQVGYLSSNGEQHGGGV